MVHFLGCHQPGDSALDFTATLTRSNGGEGKQQRVKRGVKTGIRTFDEENFAARPQNVDS